MNPDAANGLSKVEDYSPAPFTGQALLFCDYYSVLTYSTQVSTDSLPSKLADLADPKYKGRFVVTTYSSDSLYKLVVAYGKDNALEIAQGIAAKPQASSRAPPASRTSLPAMSTSSGSRSTTSLPRRR